MDDKMVLANSAGIVQQGIIGEALIGFVYFFFGSMK